VLLPVVFFQATFLRKIRGLVPGEESVIVGILTLHRSFATYEDESAEDCARRSRQAKVLQRRASESTTDVWLDDQFQHGNI
jgi:hypothetical protein